MICTTLIFVLLTGLTSTTEAWMLNARLRDYFFRWGAWTDIVNSKSFYEMYLTTDLHQLKLKHIIFGRIKQNSANISINSSISGKRIDKIKLILSNVALVAFAANS